MNPKLVRALCEAKYEADTEMIECISNCIQDRKKRITHLKLWAFSFVGILSLSALFPALKLLAEDFTQSGSYEYFSLLFSDGGSVMSYWREFIFTILESLPVVSILISLSLIFVFFLSIKHIIKQISSPKSVLTGPVILSY